MTGVIHDVTIEPLHVTSTGQRYRALYEGEVIVESSRQACYDAARELILAGADHDDRIRILGPDGGLRLHGRLGGFAASTIVESSTVSIRVARWSPRLFGGEDAHDA
jgi:hypothetical protein